MSCTTCGAGRALSEVDHHIFIVHRRARPPSLLSRRRDPRLPGPRSPSPGASRCDAFTSRVSPGLSTCVNKLTASSPPCDTRAPDPPTPPARARAISRPRSPTVTRTSARPGTCAPPPGGPAGVVPHLQHVPQETRRRPPAAGRRPGRRARPGGVGAGRYRRRPGRSPRRGGDGGPGAASGAPAAARPPHPPSHTRRRRRPGGPQGGRSGSGAHQGQADGGGARRGSRGVQVKLSPASPWSVTSRAPTSTPAPSP